MLVFCQYKMLLTNVISVLNHISPDVIQKAIVALDVKKATGHDYISAKILKMCSNSLAVPLTYLFNLVLLTVIFLCTVNMLL